MNGHDDTRLAELLSDAVSDVEPRSALEDIRDRTRVTSITSRRPWLLATGGAVIATAAVITAIAFAGGSPTGTTVDPGPVAPGGSESVEPNPPAPTEAEDSPPPTSAVEPPTPVVPVYYVGETPEGPRLFREFQPNVDDVDPALAGAVAAVTGGPLDPDYRTLWPAGAEVPTVDYTDDVIEVDLTGIPRELPAGMTGAEAALALEQVIYTVQGALGQGRLPVQFLLDGDRTDMVLGRPTSEPLANGPVLQTLSRVSLTEPAEGQTVKSGGELVVEGVANSFEANVVVRLQRSDGTEVIDPQPITAEGYMAEKLFPFAGTLDLSVVPAGAYLLSASTDDPTGQGLAHVDTRTIVVE